MAKYQRHKISYCPICGYVDLTGKECNCRYCNSVLENTTDFFDEICSQLESPNKEDIEEYVRQLYVYSNNKFNEDIMSKREKDEKISEQIDYYENIIINKDDNPKCPLCTSTNIQKIGNVERVVSVAMLGIFSKKINKSFKCYDCGYTW